MRETMACECSLFLPKDDDKPNNKSEDVVWVRVWYVLQPDATCLPGLASNAL